MADRQGFTLKDNNLCCGCLACVAICPTGALVNNEDEKGFVYPKLNPEKCVKCSKCVDVCEFNIKRFDNGKYVGKIFAARALNEDILLKTSSGGIAHILADWFIKNGGTVYGCTITNNFEIIHKKVDDIDEINGSKYVQSKMLSVYKTIEEELKAEIKVLFFGVDCQVSSLKQYLKKRGLGESLLSNLFTVDVLCHGVPSPGVFRNFLKYMEKRNKSKVKHIIFRTKEKGWISAMSGNKILFENDKTVSMDLFQSLFFSYVILRESCTNCPSRSLERKSDITLSDFWNVKKFVPDAYNSKGCSRVMLNTEQGENLFNKIKEQIFCVETDVLSLDGVKQFSENPSIPSREREKFYKSYVNNPNSAFEKYSLIYFLRRLKKSIKSRIKF